MTITSTQFDIALGSMAFASYYLEWGPQEGAASTFTCGLHFFALARLVDRICRQFFLKNCTM